MKMFDNLLAFLGPAIAGLSIYTIIEKSTPILAWIGLIVGIITSILAAIYYIKKIKGRV